LFFLTFYSILLHPFIFLSLSLSSFLFSLFFCLRPLRTILADAPAARISAEQVAANMGWLTWVDVFKTVLRAVIMDRES